MHARDIEFASDGLSVPAGAYLMCLYHKPKSGDWKLTGSTYYPNPVKVIVKAAPLEPDVFEENDSVVNASYLPLEFTDGAARVTTDGSNTHSGTDVDYYWINLEEGYRYAVSPRMHDSYSSGTGEQYSNDMVWSYYIYQVSDDWGELYDDVMEDTITLPDGGAILFWVAPYFEGGTGTYLFEIEATRVSTTQSGTIAKQSLRIYPNPTSDMLHIRETEPLDRITLIDIHGRIILAFEASGTSCSLDMTGLEEGIFFLKISRNGVPAVHKIIKQ
jgi:hypothetical protein